MTSPRAMLAGAGLALAAALPFGAAAWAAGASGTVLAAAAACSALVGAVAGQGIARRRNRAVQAAVRRYHALLSRAERVAQLGCAELDLKTGQSLWSDQFHAILGFAPGRVEPTQAHFLECVHGNDRAEVEAALVQARTLDQRIEINFRIVRPSGEIRIIHGRADVVRDSQGVPLRLDAIIQDVTERKRLEDELDGLIRELWRSNEELEQFAYVASHDLRQPLRVVGSYVSLLEEELHGNLPGDAPDYMNFVRDGVRRMDRLINDLLTYSRVGRIVTDQPVAMAEALRAAVDDLQFELEDAGGVVRVAEDLPIVLGDQSEMERLFQNLIGNAIKYRRPNAPPEIEVSCADLGDAWKISVKDNGIGIPAEHAERVFGIFQRLHARNEFEGTGVGLAIAKKIVERHGGSIRVDPEAVDGACLQVLWPKAALASGA